MSKKYAQNERPKQRASALLTMAMLLLSVGILAQTHLGQQMASAADVCQNLGVSSVKASSNDGNVPENTLDGNINNRWSAYGVGSWINYDLGSSQTVCFVDIDWYKGSSRVYNLVISVSQDGTSYTDVFNGKSSGNEPNFESYDFADVSARHVKITVNGNNNNQWASISEVDIYGSNGDVIPAPGGGSADTTAPSIIAPAGITKEATGPLTVANLGTPTVSDNADATPTVTNNAPSAGFPLGTTAVIWTATDDSGNSATATQSITIKDTTAPTINAPADKVVTATGTLTSVTLGSASASDAVDSTPTVANNAPSLGFPLGETQVTWTAKDDAGNTGTDMQTVTVNPIAIPPPSAGSDGEFSIIGVQASSNDGNVPENTLDDNLSTRWSAYGMGSWIEVELSKSVSVQNVSVAWYNGASRVNDFVVATSDDGTTFTDAYSGKSSGASTQLEGYDTTDKTAKYVRFTVTGNSQNNWASITELAVNGAQAYYEPEPTPTPTPAPTPTPLPGDLLTAPVFVKKWATGMETSSVEVSSTNDVYVAPHDNRVQVYTFDGTFKFQWGSGGSGNGQFSHPHGIAIDRTTNTIYVGDQNNHRIQVFNAQGQFIKQIANSDLVHIHDIGIDPNDGLIYAPDYEANHLQKINPATGAIVWKKTGLSGGWGVSVDSQGYVYLAATNSQQLHKINPIDGSIIKSVGGFSGGQGITGVYVDKNNLIYALDNPKKTVFIYDTNLTLKATWNLGQILGSGVTKPEDIVISSDDQNIYVADSVADVIWYMKRTTTTPTPTPTPTPTTDTTLPTVAITFPANGATVSGLIVGEATASDNMGISTVAGFIDANALNVETGAPYQYTIDTTKYANGLHTFKVTATDTSGNKASHQISVNINNVIIVPTPTPTPTPDSTLPNVSINNPSNGQSFSAGTTSVTVSGTASDNVGVTLVEKSINGGPFSPASGTTSWSFTASGLTNGQSYTATVRAKDAAGNTKSAMVSFSVQSPPLPGTSLPDSFAAAGDWDCTSDTSATISNINVENPDAVLSLGDMSYATTGDCWFSKVSSIDSKMHISIGNHDAADRSGYLSHYGLAKSYYSFDMGNVHLISMDSELSYGVGSAQYNFVNNDLISASQSSSIDWIVVYFHQPMYTSPTHHAALDSLRDTYHPLFDQYDVDLVLQSHNHNYQRSYPLKYDSASPTSPIITSTNANSYTNPDGAIFMTAGTGGRSHYSLDSKASFTQNQFSDVFGALFVTVASDGTTDTLSGKFIANGASHTVRDSFTISKTANEPSPTPTPTPDTTLPSISITVPTNGQSFAAGTTSVTVSGTASDNVGVSLVEKSINGGAFSPASGTTSWSFTATGLSDGQSYTATIRAKDAAGNIKSVTVVFSIQLPSLPPPPTGGSDSSIIWSSIKWSNGHERTISDHEEFDPYDPYLQIAAGNNRKLYIDGQGHAFLSGERARMYIFGENYNAVMELKFVMDGSLDNLSLKMRSRHNEGGTEENRFGGYGMAFHHDSVDIKRENYHNDHTSISSTNLSKPLVDGQEYTIRYTVRDDGSGNVSLIGEIDYHDGKGFVKVVDVKDNDPLSYMVDKELYLNGPTISPTSSYAWIRTNGASPQDIKISDVKIINLD